MLEVIYRIYEVISPHPDYGDDDGKRIISQEVLICESRQRFKEILLDLYSDEALPLKFRASGSYQSGQKYCVIIGESCWNTEGYTTIVDCHCDNCNANFHALAKHIYRIAESTIKFDLGADYEEYGKYRYCSDRCRKEHQAKLIREYVNNSDMSEDSDLWVTKNNLSAGMGGYIYKITKRSSGEFYVGQSVYVPVFRWGQHLRTSRFPIGAIDDYIFEVLEIVQDARQLNKREKHWIQTMFKQNPDLSLNISLTKTIDPMQQEMKGG